jgi:hypothetical protein
MAMANRLVSVISFFEPPRFRIAVTHEQLIRAPPRQEPDLVWRPGIGDNDGWFAASRQLETVARKIRRFE